MDQAQGDALPDGRNRFGALGDRRTPDIQSRLVAGRITLVLLSVLLLRILRDRTLRRFPLSFLRTLVVRPLSVFETARR